MRNRKQRVVPALAAAVLAGATVPFIASASTAASTAASGLVAPQEHAPVTMYLGADLVGSDVANAKGETVATIDDVAVDRGTGVIHYVILRDGGLLGFGGTRIAVPFETFGFDLRNDRFTLDVTDEILERAESFASSRWIVLDGDDPRAQLDAACRKDRGASTDPWRKKLADRDETTIEGNVLAVERRRFDAGDEFVVVTVGTDQTESRRPQKVVVGPSWFVMGQADAPSRGDRVLVRGWAATDDGGEIVARTIDCNSSMLRLRDAKGHARWNAESDGPRESAGGGVSRHVMLGELSGMPIHTVRKETGSIDDAVVDVGSGRIAFLAVDPDENVLGIGDEIKCVPWPVAAVGREAVHLDVTRPMLLDGAALPDDVSTIALGAFVEPTYRTYGVKAPSFTKREHRPWRPANAMKGWSNGGALAIAFDEGSPTTIDGVIRSMSGEKEIGRRQQRLASASVVVIEQEGKRHTLLLGPTWYVEQQDLSFEKGDEVTIAAREIEFDGRRHLVVQSIRTDDGRTLRMWRNGRPVWDAG